MRKLLTIVFLLMLTIPFSESKSPEFDYYLFKEVNARVINIYESQWSNGNTHYYIQIEVIGNYTGYYYEKKDISTGEYSFINGTINIADKQKIRLNFIEKTGEKPAFYHPENGELISIDFEYCPAGGENGSLSTVNYIELSPEYDSYHDHDNMDFKSFLELRKTEPVWFWTTLIVPIVVILLVIFTIVKLRNMKKVQNKGQDADSIKTPAPKVIRHQKIK